MNLKRGIVAIVIAFVALGTVLMVLQGTTELKGTYVTLILLSSVSVILWLVATYREPRTKWIA